MNNNIQINHDRYRPIYSRELTRYLVEVYFSDASTQSVADNVRLLGLTFFDFATFFK